MRAVTTTLDAALSALFTAERDARRIHDEIAARAGRERKDVLAALTGVITAARAEEDPEEASLRLACVARLLGELDGADVVDALVDVLDSDLPEARSAAGEQLEGLAYERFKEVALGVERAVKRFGTGSHALVELPYLLAEVPEPGVSKLLALILGHADPDAVAAAIEAIVMIGDASAKKLLLALQGDKRVSIVGEDQEQTRVTVGELAMEAIELLSQHDAGDAGDDDAPEDEA